MDNTIKCFVIWALMLFVTVVDAQPLRPEDAFKPSITQVVGNTIDIRIDMPEGYYVYRETRFDVSVDDGLVIKDTALSSGIIKNDAFFGEQSVWYGGKNIANISVTYDNPNRLRESSIQLTFQGCQDGVICYPPQKIDLPVVLPADTKHSVSGKLFAQSTQSQQPLRASTSLSDNGRKHLLKTGSRNKDILREDEAFPFTIEAIDATTLALRFNVAKDYYLYRDKIRFDAVDANNLEDDSLIADIKFRGGSIYRDKFYGEQIIYRGNNIVANIYLTRPVSKLSLSLQFQGCADKGICYPVMHRKISLENGFVDSVKTVSAPLEKSTVEQFGDTLKNNLWAGVGLLLLAGIALSFTPCVLPMLPILLGIITNQRKVSKPRAFMLSSVYALGVAAMMAAFGLVVAKTGINIQIIFQQPLWLMIFAGIFIVMGLAMLGVFNIAMPSSVQSKVINWQNRFQETNALSMFVVGALSTLVVGPCVAPPLIAILAFISTTGDSVLGALYLFALGLGMSLPLVIFASLITSIPKTGALSRLVTRIFAMLMFGVGLWLLGRLLPGWLVLILWGVFMGVLAIIFWRSGFIKLTAQRFTKLLAIGFSVIGFTWLVGGAMGNSNPLKPFTKVAKLSFTYVNSLEELNSLLANSKKPVMVDLYADWCVSCQEVEHFTLADAEVVKKLNDFTLLKLDITKTSDAHRELLAEYDLIGPPVMLFFKDSKEIRDKRHVGIINSKVLLQKLNHIFP